MYIYIQLYTCVYHLAWCRPMTELINPSGRHVVNLTTIVTVFNYVPEMGLLIK